MGSKAGQLAERGVRTPDWLARMPNFERDTLNRTAASPCFELAFAERIPYRRGDGFPNAEFALLLNNLKERKLKKNDGAPERIRTSDPQIRSLVLYPAELRARGAWTGPGRSGL